jgi:hypothetical protein
MIVESNEQTSKQDRKRVIRKKVRQRMKTTCSRWREIQYSIRDFPLLLIRKPEHSGHLPHRLSSSRDLLLLPVYPYHPILCPGLLSLASSLMVSTRGQGQRSIATADNVLFSSPPAKRPRARRATRVIADDTSEDDDDDYVSPPATRRKVAAGPRKRKNVNLVDRDKHQVSEDVELPAGELILCYHALNLPRILHVI